ncbi:hypothetical protein F1649_06880 [Arcticibacter tournemirensis]|uniref:DUF4374 domain-containing protein n=1 Tax=Arcticibacter tournemirensis TaxID=699437 RepID=A0A5M9HAT5_9SPHI|nr:hypothetical protein [Arcticibacter tournemirensis]KAA8484063.1 hypothetical protein F1649_06880 [Arcticibacter tournemirensis]
MKKVYTIIIAAVMVSAGCKKNNNNEPSKQEELEPVNDPLLFGLTRVGDNYVPTEWQGKRRDTSIVSYKHKSLVVTGFYERSIVTPNGVGKGIEYYGNEVTDGKGSRLCQFLEKSTPFSESAGRKLDPSYVEWSQGCTSYNGSTYIIAIGRMPGQRVNSYYYKIDGQTRKITSHPLAPTPNGNGYAWHCGTSKGLIVSKSLSPDTKKTFLEVFREDNWIQDYKLEVPGHIYIDVENLFAKDDNHLIAIVACKRAGTPITGLFYFTINLTDHTVKLYQAEMPEANFHINKGAYVNNTVYLPYYENGSNKCAYVTLKLDPNTGKLVTNKFDLPTKAGVPYGSATLIGTEGNNVYVAGEQGGLACYWRNDKLIDIENKETTSSVITAISVYD